MAKKKKQEILERLSNINNIIITQDVEDFILDLEAKAADKVIRSIELLSEFGFYLPKTDYHRLWDSKYKLWELITSLGKNEYRSLFFSLKDDNFLIAHAIIKNTKRVPIKDIQTADKVYKDYLDSLERQK
ncbi:MAG: type II toxin-antitoxin system RelE/ParE family toxin [Clostridiaceae bacterium]|nr:type II toxin-antitoxin system RelE/ParE family toxin [Clostridiaceae bacterium]